ncbi:MAG: S49 family peptidase [Caulobacter sp.]|nr:S49 family peptidase [Caulobacter sp.]
MRFTFLTSAASAFEGRALCVRPDAIPGMVSHLARVAGLIDDDPAPAGLGGLIASLRGGAARTRQAPAGALAMASGTPGAIRMPYGERVEGVAVIRIEGCLWQEAWTVSWGGETFLLADGYDRVVSAVTAAVNDGEAHAVLLDVRSPGGVVAGMFEAMDAIAALSQRQGGPKPIVAHANDLACSAAYGLVSQCDRIEAAQSSLTGNVGSCRSHYSFADYLAKEGVKPTLFKSHALKGGGSPDFELDPGSAALFDAEVRHGSANLVARVCASRGLEPDAVNALEAGWFIPPVSLSHGLIDGVSAFADCLAGLAAQSTPAASAAPASTQEMNMKRTEVLAALAAANLTAAQIAAVSAELPAEDEEDQPAEEAAAEGEDDAPAEGEENEPAAAEGEDPADDEEDKVDAKTAKAILALPEAKGREALAQKLAFTPGMSTATAKELLASAARSGGLRADMQGRDPALSAGGAGGPIDLGAMLVADAKDRAAARKAA